MNVERTDASIPANWTPAVRVDRGRLSKATKTAVGVRVEGVVSKVGVLTYTRADGSVVREFLPPEEAGRLDSLASLRDAPVTVMHPAGGTRMVTPATYRSDAVGHVSGEPRFDGRHVIADLAIQDGKAIDRVDAGELRELSAGYRCLIDPTPGVFQGQKYDAVQRSREYNHTALLPAGAARAGADASLRLDGTDCDDVAVMRFDEDDDRTPMRVPARAGQPEARVDSVKTIERIDGRDYEVGTPEWRAKLDAVHAAAIAEVEKRAKVAEDRAATEKARADSAEKRVKDLEAELTPARVNARVAERTALIERVRPVLGKDEKLDGLSLYEIRLKTVMKLDPEFKADAVPEAQREIHVNARFESDMRHVKTDAASAGTPPPSPLGRARLDAVTPPAGAAHFDADDGEVEGRLEDAWKTKR